MNPCWQDTMEGAREGGSIELGTDDFIAWALGLGACIRGRSATVRDTSFFVASPFGPTINSFVRK